MSGFIRTKGLELVGKGYQICAIAPGKKYPVGQEWQKHPYSELDCLSANEEFGVGILCGIGANPIVGIDCDILDTELANKTRDLLYETIPSLMFGSAERTGKPPKFLVPAVIDSPVRKFSSSKFKKGDLTCQVEFLGAGNQFVAYSTHPDTGKPYEWGGITGCELSNFEAKDLPVVSRSSLEEFMKKFEKLARDSGYEFLERGVAASTKAASFEDLGIEVPPVGLSDEAITRLLSDCGVDGGLYNNWLMVGMALHHETSGTVSGLSIWDAWSQKQPGYKGIDDLQAKWNSFGKGGQQKITIRWLQRQKRAKSPLADDPSQIGIAYSYVAENGGYIRYAEDTGKWFMYRSSRWHATGAETIASSVQGMLGVWLEKRIERAEKDGEGTEKRWLKTMVTCRSNPNSIDNIMKAIRREPSVICSSDGFNLVPELFSVSNKVIRLTTGEILDPSPEFMLSKGSPVTYDEEAKCPKWRKFVSDIMDGDEEMASYLKRVCGYIAMGDPKHEVMFVFLGKGRNGKSKFLDTLCQVLGRSISGGSGGYATNVDRNLLVQSGRRMAQSAGAPNEALLRLQGARLAVCEESDGGAVLNEAAIKSITGRDAQCARGIHAKEATTFTPQCVLVLATNALPTISDQTDATWARMRIIDFPVNFYTTTKYERNDRIGEELRAEESGILNWLLEAVEEYKQRGLDDPKRVRERCEEEKDAADTLVDWRTERCIEGPNEEALSGELYESWRDFVRTSGDDKKLSKQKFTKLLKAKYGHKVAAGNRTKIIGLSVIKDFKTDTQLALEFANSDIDSYTK